MVKGFENLGNTCYLNAGLQLIINNIDLCKNIINYNGDDEIIIKYKQFINRYYDNDNSKILNPTFIKIFVGENNSEFIDNRQNDSFEFVLYFLDYLLTQIKSNIYEIEITTHIKCKLLKCLNISSNKELNNFLLLNINNTTNTLDDCYRQFKTREKLMNDNAYFCDKCKDYRIASKHINITNWSKHLLIVLKRFNNYRIKIDKEIIIPLEWRHNYKLQGFICHSGTINGGHYVYIGKYNDKWLLYNDDHISPINDLNVYLNYGYVYYYIKS